MEKLLKVVCTYCGEVYAYKEGHANETTHGCCDKCRPGALQAAERYTYKPGVRT